MPLPSAGGGSFLPNKPIKLIRLLLKGHTNRPFFHIAVTSKFAPPDVHPVEQLGTYDPMPNKDNQKLLSLNVERMRFWMSEGATFSKPLAMLLGKAGVLPIHPDTYINSWRYRHKVVAEAAEKRAAEIESGSGGPPKPPSSSSS